MNKDKLIKKLNTKFYAVDEAGIHEGKTEAGITVWGIGVFDLVGDTLSKKNLTFYTDVYDNGFWGNSEPNPTIPTQKPTFTDRVNVFIASKIDDMTIEFGFIEQVLEHTRKAWVSAITSTGIVKNAIVTEDIEGNFSIDVL
jgi:hypothetical protein